MKLDKSVIPYLKDENFSNGLVFKTARSKSKLENRLDYLCDYAANKKVLHVGCVDHVPLIKEKIKNNTWLHKRIDDVAKKQLGIDINREGLNYLREELGYTNIIFEDIVSDTAVDEQIKSEQWDIMILGEILEHVDNPVEFLKKLKQKYAPYVKELVITVPNAFDLANFYLSFRGKECINTDHRAWFSVFTLSKNLVLAGFDVSFYDYVISYASDYKGSWKRFLLKKFPQFCSTLIIAGKF